MIFVLDWIVRCNFHFTMEQLATDGFDPLDASWNLFHWANQKDVHMINTDIESPYDLSILFDHITNEAGNGNLFV